MKDTPQQETNEKNELAEGKQAERKVEDVRGTR